MAVSFEKPSAKVWMQAVCAGLQGSDPDNAIHYADIALLAYEARFGDRTDERRTQATVILTTALQFFERNALIGKSVLLMGQVDCPPMGKIIDFTEENVLVEWTSVKSGKHSEDPATLQLIAGLDLEE